MKKEDLNDYFLGRKLYGDDFTLEEIKKWYKDEEEGYSGLVGKNYVYEFHALNILHGYRKIKKVPKFNRVLSLGGATGDELLPVIHKAEEIYIVEPSKKLRVKSLGKKKVKYVTPMAKGELKFKDNFFDLIACFGTLHHIPNVNYVFSELTRVLKKEGYFLLREPIVSMGDWRKSRKGLTKRERGIPLDILRKMVKENGFEIISEKKVLFPLLRRIDFKNYKGGNSEFWVKIDYLLGKFFGWNYRYHSTKFYHKLQPQSVFYVLRKK